MEIRPAQPDELEEVGRLTGEVYVADGYVRELVDTPRRAREAELWAAVEGGLILGSVTFCPVGSPYREIGRDDEGEFRMLGVSAAARGLGIGTLLTEHCIQRSRDLGFTRVVMSSAQAMTTAHRIYGRLGFTRLPARDWSPRPGVDLYAFTLDL